MSNKRALDDDARSVVLSTSRLFRNVAAEAPPPPARTTSPLSRVLDLRDLRNEYELAVAHRLLAQRGVPITGSSLGAKEAIQSLAQHRFFDLAFALALGHDLPAEGILRSLLLALFDFEGDISSATTTPPPPLRYIALTPSSQYAHEGEWLQSLPGADSGAPAHTLLLAALEHYVERLTQERPVDGRRAVLALADVHLEQRRRAKLPGWLEARLKTPALWGDLVALLLKHSLTDDALACFEEYLHSSKFAPTSLADALAARLLAENKAEQRDKLRAQLARLAQPRA